MFLDSIEARMSFSERDKALLVKLADKDGNDVISLGEFFGFLKTDLGMASFGKQDNPSMAPGDDYGDGYDDYGDDYGGAYDADELDVSTCPVVYS